MSLTVDRYNLSMGQLFLVSIPSMLGLIADPLASMVDTAFVGQTNETWLAGLGIASTIFNSFTWIFNFLVLGIPARIAQAHARGESVASDVWLSLLVASLLGVVAMTIVIGLYDRLMIDVMGASASLSEQTWDYFLPRALAIPFIIVLNSMLAILRGALFFKFAAAIPLSVAGINILLNYLFLFHLEMGFSGVGVATLLAFTIGFLLATCLLFIKREHFGLTSGLKVCWREVMTFGSEAVAMFGRTASLLLVLFTATTLASHLGANVVAAHQVGLQFWLFCAFFCDGLAVTATSLTAAAMGGGSVQIYNLIRTRLMTLGFIVGALLSLIFLLFDKQLMGMFVGPGPVADQLDKIWVLLCLAQPINALVFVLDGVLFGLRAFGFARNHMLFGVLAVYFPIAAWTAVWGRELAYLWFGVVLFNLYRLVSGYLGTMKQANV